jgi:hypothetical protein
VGLHWMQIFNKEALAKNRARLYAPLLLLSLQRRMPGRANCSLGGLGRGSAVLWDAIICIDAAPLSLSLPLH